MKHSTSIIAYIGNGVVKGGLVYHEKGKKPLVLSSRRRMLKYVTDRTRDQIESMILSEFEQLLLEIKTKDFPRLHNKKCGKPESALIVLSSPWYLSETNEIKLQEANSFTVSKELINKATSNIIKAYSGDKSNIAVLEQNFLSVKLNGYDAVDPIGKKVKDLDINVLTSYMRADTLNKIENLVSSNFHLHNIHIHSQTLVSYSTIGDLYPMSKDYVVVDVTSQLTELLIIKNNILRDSASTPKGKYFVMQSIAKSMISNLESSETLISSYMDNKLDQESLIKVENAINIAKKEWLADLSVALKHITSNGSLPKQFYLFAPHGARMIFKHFLESEEYQQFALAEGKFEVKVIDTIDTVNACAIDAEANANNEMDVSIAVGALFNNKKLFT